MENLRELQLIELTILKAFIKICKQHNLRYYCIGGTALGAVRHKGFIPWDDDIDVSMPREDYERISQIFAEFNFNINGYDLVNIDNCKEHLHPFTKLVDRRVSVTISKANCKSTNHAWIDIFPMDGLPRLSVIRWFHVRLFLILKSFFHISVFNERVDQTKKRPLYEMLILQICNRFPVQKLFNKNKRIKAADKVLKRCKLPGSSFCSPQLWGQYKTRAVFPTDWIGEGVSLPFEDISVIVPINYCKYLRQLYGDNFMELPPEEKRATHTSEIILDWGGISEKI